MKRLLFLNILLFLTFCSGHGNTTVSGTILSVTGEPMPVSTIDVSATGPTNIFTQHNKVYADKSGSFSITFENPGIYTLTIRSVFHKSVRVPIMIYDQDKIGLDIYLLPHSYNNGDYFDQQVYLKWIRAYGNFNGYDFFSGEIFRANEDGSISAFIKTDLDTIRYQIRGLTRGATVLPGADEYSTLGSDFEAVIVNSTETDSIELRFNPDKKQPYARVLPEAPVSWQVSLAAFVHFHDDNDKYWSLPLEKTHSTRLMYYSVSPTKDIGIPPAEIKKAMFRSYGFRSSSQMSAYRDSVLSALQIKDLHPQQRSALLISYLGSIQHQRNRERYLQSIGQDSSDLNIHPDVFDEVFRTVDPRNPVWALNDQAPLMLLQETNYSDEAVSYTEQMIRNHADGMVVRHLVLSLIERFANDYESVAEMPYYSLIVNRYGERHLARRAVLAFQQSKNNR